MRQILHLGCLLCIVLLSSWSVAQEEESEEGASTQGTTAYYAIKPEFVLNYGGVGRLRYLKTEITLRVEVSAGSTAMQDVRHHLPYIRHVLVMLFSKQTEETMSSMEGRELLRQEALAAVKQVLIDQAGKEGVLDLLFDSFIVQR